MHDHGNPDGGLALPDPTSAECHAQRLLLLELVVTPPPEGDELDYLRRRLPMAPELLEPAIVALQAAGLASRCGDVVHATGPARYFEHLWPVRL